MPRTPPKKKAVPSTRKNVRRIRRRQIGDPELLPGIIAVSSKKFDKLSKPRPVEEPDLQIEFPGVPKNSAFFWNRRGKDLGPKARKPLGKKKTKK